jgi:2-oxoglutarate dehydrogenase E2 component (dihydrolipoamide succinyltransferase)
MMKKCAQQTLYSMQRGLIQQKKGLPSVFILNQQSITQRNMSVSVFHQKKNNNNNNNINELTSTEKFKINNPYKMIQRISSTPLLMKRMYASGGSEQIVNVPYLGDSITEGTIDEWVKNVGDFAEMDEVVVKIATDKVTAEVRAPVNCVVTKHFASPGSAIKVGSPLFSYTASDKAPEGAKKAAETPKPKEVPVAAAAAPPVAAVEKSKPQEAPKKEPEAPKPSAAPMTPPQKPGERTETRVKMPMIRQRIAARLKEAQNEYAMLTTFNEVDMSAIINLRQKYQDEFQERHGIKLGFMSPFVKASTLALQKLPIVNAVIEGNEIVYRNYIDISVAVATPTGLVVPVLRNCETKSFADIEKEIYELGQKAKTNSIKIEEMKGGTFTISNGGVFGSLMGTPIINSPQSAILGMHATNKRPVVVNDQIVIRPMMYLALTYDHRIIDGREAVTFLKTVKEFIEDPQRMLLV